MKQVLIPLIILGYLGHSYSQTMPGIEYHRTRTLSFSISDLTDLTAPSLLIGFNHSLSPVWSVFAEGGPLTKFGIGRNLNGFKFRFEVRRYQSDSADRHKRFSALQFMVRQFMEKDLEGYFKLNGSTTGIPERFDYDYAKTVNAIHLVRGTTRTWDRLSMEFAMFAGLRFRYPDFIGLPSDAEFVQNTSYFLFPYLSHRQEDADIWPSIGFSFRVGFRL